MLITSIRSVSPYKKTVSRNKYLNKAHKYVRISTIASEQFLSVYICFLN